jgi:hypothetical protein
LLGQVDVVAVVYGLGAGLGTTTDSFSAPHIWQVRSMLGV